MQSLDIRIQASLSIEAYYGVAYCIFAPLEFVVRVKNERLQLAHARKAGLVSKDSGTISNWRSIDMTVYVPGSLSMDGS